MRAIALGLHALNLAAVAGLLFLCQQLLRAHDALAAMVVLGVAGLLVLLQFSKRLQAWRYVMPGVSAVLVFIVLPMAFTLGIAFTNYSSAHLLSFERATDARAQREHGRRRIFLSPSARVPAKRFERAPLTRALAALRHEHALQHLVQPGAHVRARIEAPRERERAQRRLLHDVARLLAAARAAKGMRAQRRQVFGQAVSNGQRARITIPRAGTRIKELSRHEPSNRKPRASLARRRFRGFVEDFVRPARRALVSNWQQRGIA